MTKFRTLRDEPGHSAVTMTSEERDTVLAALRFWQSAAMPSEALEDIATNGGEHEMLSPEEIDDLCERINC